MKKVCYKIPPFTPYIMKKLHVVKIMQEDAILVKQTLEGDEQAFHRLIMKYYAKIYALILSWVKNPEDAKDLTQEVFLEAYLDLGSLRNREQFRIWLRQIARHQCHDWLRKEKTYVQLDEDMICETPSADETLILRETLAKMMRAIDELPESESQLLKDRYLDDVSYDDLEAKHGLSQSALAMRLLRAKRHVREKIKKSLPSILILSWQDMAKKIFVGGVEAMKISAKVKLIAIGVTAILILGGTGVIVWHYQQSAQETPNLIASQISQKVAIGSSKDLLSKSNSSNKYISTHSASQMTANQEQKEKQVEKAGASIDSMDGVSQATTESKETPAELLQRYLKITNSPEFQEEFHKVVDPLEVETYPYYDKIKELENKEKEQEHDLETASSEDQSKIQDELEKTKSKLWETRVEKTEKVILMADAIHLLHLKYFTNEEFLIIRKETARTMPRPGLYIDDKTIEMNAKLKPEAMARLKAGGWVPANPDESWY